MGKAFIFGMFGLIAIGLGALAWFLGGILLAWSADLLRTFRSGKK